MVTRTAAEAAVAGMAAVAVTDQPSRNLELGAR
jgi:hypothetical protein